MYQPKDNRNWGSLCRTGYILGADFIATIGKRFPQQPSDTTKSWRHIPFFEFSDFDSFFNHLPHECLLVGIEMTEGAKLLSEFSHPQRACYILGAEDYGLPKTVLDECHSKVRLLGERSMNVAVAGSIVIYDRRQKESV